MLLTTKIESDITDAMKSRDRERLDTLRMLHAALKNERIALSHELSDEESQKVVTRLVKQRREAAEQYRTGNRAEQADKEEAEAQILEAYLPAQLTEDELRVIVSQAVSETGAQTTTDFGKVMGIAMAKTKGAADGNRVATIVREFLK